MLYPKLPSEFVFKFGGIFLCPFSGSYLSAHTKQNLSIHSISENGRKPVKKISASATVLLTLKVEVQSPYNRITISYNRKGHRAFAVFLCRFLLESAVGLFLICGVVLRLSIWIFYISKIQMGGIYGEICTKKGIYQRKWRLCGIILHGVLPLQGIRPDLEAQGEVTERTDSPYDNLSVCFFLVVSFYTSKESIIYS